MSDIQIALVMTAVGMGIVFIGIFILWGLMALMVRIWPHDGGKGEKQEEKPSEEPASGDDSLKARAAAAAVAVAISLRQSAFNLTPGAVPAQSGSSWRVTTRAMEINQGTQSFNRKSRGNDR